MSETTNLKLFKHDNVETNTNKFDIDKALNENWDRIDEFVTNIDCKVSEVDTKNTEQDTKITEINAKDKEQDNEILQLQTENAELESELKELQEDFYNNSLREEVSGEYIHIEDCGNCRCKIGILGNSKQEGEPSPDNPVEIQKVGNNTNLFDKSKITQGKRLSMTGEYIAEEGYFVSDYIEVKEYQNYTLSYKPDAYTRVCYYSDKAENTFLGRNDSKQTFTTLAETKYIRFSNLIIHKDKIKVEQGITTTSYSPYGQKIIETNICNKNIMPILDLGTNWEYTEKGIKNKGKNEGTQITSFTVKKGKIIRFGFKLLSAITTDTSFSISVNGTPAMTFGKLQSSELEKIYTNTHKTTEDTIITIKMWGNENADIFEFQLWAELGELTDYVQYKGQNYVIPIQEEMLEDDYINFETEEEVHTWGKIENYNKETITTKYISTTGELTEGATIYYKLAEIKRLAFTDEQKDATKKIRKARTYENITNATANDIAIIKLDYAKDLEKEQNKIQNEIDEIKQLLSTTQTSALLLDNLQKDLESEVK